MYCTLVKIIVLIIFMYNYDIKDYCTVYIEHMLVHVHITRIKVWWLEKVTVEPPYKGHIGTKQFVLYIEVVLSLEVQNVKIWNSSFGTIKPVLCIHVEVFSNVGSVH